MLPVQSNEPHEIEAQRKTDRIRNAEEILRKAGVEVVSNGLPAMGRINPEKADFSKHYCWALNKPEAIILKQNRGYEIVKSPRLKDGERGLTDFQQTDGTHRRGDTILMQVDKAVKEAWDVLDERRALTALDDIRQSFDEAVARAGGKPVAA